MSGALGTVAGCRWSSLDSRAKIVGAMGGAMAISAAPGLATLGMQLVVAGAMVAGGRLSWRWVLQRCALVTPFAAMMAAFLAFERAPDYAPSLLVLGKAYGSVLVLGMLVASTPVPELVAGLQRLRVPAVLVVTASFTYRYAQLLEEEWARMDRARLSRSGRAPRQVAWGPRLAALFVRSWDRGERVAAAMSSRGFAGRLPLGPARALRAGDYAFAGTMLLLGVPLLLR